MSNKKPTHRLVYVTDTYEKDGQTKEATVTVGAAWQTEGNALFISPSVPLTLIPGDNNLKLLPIKDK